MLDFETAAAQVGIVRTVDLRDQLVSAVNNRIHAEIQDAAVVASIQVEFWKSLPRLEKEYVC